MPLLEIAVQNQERRHCRSKTRFIGLQHVTESTLHNQSWAAKNRSLITDSAQNSLNSSLIAKKFDGCGLKNRVTSCAQDSLAQSALRRGAWWFALASRHQPLRRQNFKFTGFKWVFPNSNFRCQSVPQTVFVSNFNSWPVPNTESQSILNYIGFILFYSQWRRMELCLNY